MCNFGSQCCGLEFCMNLNSNKKAARRVLAHLVLCKKLCLQSTPRSPVHPAHSFVETFPHEEMQAVSSGERIGSKH